MPLLLDTMREEFARFLSEDPSGRFRMDAALVHVIEIAYRAGIEDGKAIGAPQASPESSLPAALHEIPKRNNGINATGGTLSNPDAADDTARKPR